MEDGLRHALDRYGRRRIPEADLPLLYAVLALTVAGQVFIRLGRRWSRDL